MGMAKITSVGLMSCDLEIDILTYLPNVSLHSVHHDTLSLYIFDFFIECMQSIDYDAVNNQKDYSIP